MQAFYHKIVNNLKDYSKQGYVKKGPPVILNFITPNKLIF